MNDREKIAKLLAEKHYHIEPSITEIHTIHSGTPSHPPQLEPIKLLEVNPNTVASGILPLWFDAVPASGIPYPSVIIEVTPGEYEQIRRNELKLPDGWLLGQPIPRPELESSSP